MSPYFSYKSTVEISKSLNSRELLIVDSFMFVPCIRETQI